MSAGQYILMTVHIIILALFLLLLKKSKKADAGCAKERGRVHAIFIRMGYYLYDLILRRERKRSISGSGPGMLIRSDRIREEMNILNPLGDAGRESREFIAEKLAAFLIALLIGNLAAMGVWAADFMDVELLEGEKLLRNNPGQGKREIDLNAYLDGDREKIRVELEESRYTQEELQGYLEEAALRLDETVPGENASLDEVRQPLFLPREIDGLPFQISWEFDNYQALDADGIPREEFLPEEGTPVKLTAVLTWRDFRGEYIRYARLFPQRKEDKSLQDRLLEAVKKADADADGSREVILPGRLENREIRWKETFHPNGVWLLLLAAGAGILLFAGQDNRLHRQVEERNRELAADYADLVYKLALLTGAGMTVRTAWKRIVQSGDKKYDRPGAANSRFLQAEMKLTLHEMENGIPEQTAYSRFGKRCGLPVYRKLGTLLVQSQKKGSQGMMDALQEEVKDAFRERKNMARKEGEEAGTKLLFPMAMMLGVVMVIIVVPAFLSFQF